MAVLSYRDLKRKAKTKPEGLKKSSIAILGDTATQLLDKAIVGYGVEKGLDIEIYEADYDQIDLQVFSPDSELYTHDSEFILIYKATEKLIKSYYKSEAKESFAERQIETLENYINTIQEKTKAKILISNFIELPDMVFNNFGNKVVQSWTYQLRKLNYKLMDLAISNPNVFIVDLCSIHNMLGRESSYSPQTHVRTDIVTSFEFVPRIAQSVVDIVASISGKFKKCLILDLDNTTWGGIIGDDGIEKIQVGSLGLGKAFTELQLWAKNLKNRGIILCICSKNTDHIAKEPFEKHPDMVLRLEDISVFVANWENKADNIRYIQSVLNIGFDSMVFLDDNPFERNLIREQLPEVTVPELPEDPAEYIPYLQQFNLFETASFSALDKDRTAQYQTEAKRKGMQKSFNSIEDYLKNLEMKADVVAFDKFNVPRIAQLTQRSNQFNLRTIRYTEQEVSNLMSSPNHKTQYVSLSDKFGNYGLISLIILEEKEQDYFIDTWIMSCRVLKRDVEKLVLNELVKLAKQENKSKLVGERIPTKKNVLVEDHYKNLGFSEQDGKWFLDVETYVPFDHFISIN